MNLQKQHPSPPPPPPPQQQRGQASSLPPKIPHGQAPNSKSQDEWLRGCGHPTLHSFLEYYGFDPQDADDTVQGKNFISQIRKQEQEQWEEAQSRPQTQSPQQAQPQLQQPQPQPQLQRVLAANPAPKIVRRSTISDGNAYTSRLPPGAAPTMNIYGLKSYEMEEAARHHHQQQQQHHHQQQQHQQQQHQQHQQQHHQHLMHQSRAVQNQIPRSSLVESSRFHNTHRGGGGGVINENVLNAYGIKPWDMDATARMRADFARFERRA